MIRPVNVLSDDRKKGTFNQMKTRTTPVLHRIAPFLRYLGHVADC